MQHTLSGFVKGEVQIEYLNAPEFFQQINTLKDNYGEGILEIRCSPNELKQFKV